MLVGLFLDMWYNSTHVSEAVVSVKSANGASLHFVVERVNLLLVRLVRLFPARYLIHLWVRSTIITSLHEYVNYVIPWYVYFGARLNYEISEWVFDLSHRETSLVLMFLNILVCSKQRQVLPWIDDSIQHSGRFYYHYRLRRQHFLVIFKHVFLHLLDYSLKYRPQICHPYKSTHH